MAKRTPKKNKDNALFDQLEEACKVYGVKFKLDEFYFEIKFKDGRSAVYPLHPFDKFSISYLPKAKGRVFSKDGKYIGNVPSSSNIETMLINADMIV